MIIAHRGSAVTYPEHSLGSYLEAYFSGCDFIDVDLQLTADKHLIVQHDKILDLDTDILQKSEFFEGRQRADGHFYVADFTLYEIKKLRRV